MQIKTFTSRNYNCLKYHGHIYIIQYNIGLLFCDTTSIYKSPHSPRSLAASLAVSPADYESSQHRSSDQIHMHLRQPHTHTHTRSLTHPHTLTQAHTLTHPCSQTHTHTHTHTHTVYDYVSHEASRSGVSLVQPTRTGAQKSTLCLQMCPMCTASRALLHVHCSTFTGWHTV